MGGITLNEICKKTCVNCKHLNGWRDVGDIGCCRLLSAFIGVIGTTNVTRPLEFSCSLHEPKKEIPVFKETNIYVKRDSKCVLGYYVKNDDLGAYERILTSSAVIAMPRDGETK